MPHTFHVSSALPVPADRFWRSQSLATVNAELHPMYRMSAPRVWRTRPIHEWGRHERLFRSWILLRGLVPVDRHHFGTIEFPAGTTFVETSSSWLNRRWRHERTVSPTESGCEVSDRVSFESRLPFCGAWQKALYVLAFRQRHANLRSLHGDAVG